MISLNILGLDNVTVEVPQLSGLELTPEKVMHNAKRRFARQGAERVTLVPARNGQGWVRKDNA